MYKYLYMQNIKLIKLRICLQKLSNNYYLVFLLFKMNSSLKIYCLSSSHQITAVDKIKLFLGKSTL